MSLAGTGQRAAFMYVDAEMGLPGRQEWRAEEGGRAWYGVRSGWKREN